MYKLLNNILSKYFGIGVFLALVLGFNFRYMAFSLSSYGLYFLFLLMFLSGFTIDFQQVKWKTIKKKLLFTNLLIFISTPIVVWIFANFLLDDNQYIYGLIFSALTPAAAVAPFFTNYFGGNKNDSFVYLISSMLLSPLLIPIILMILAGNSLSIPGILLFKDILILVPMPIILSFLVKKFLPIVFKTIKKSLPILNFLLLFLIFFSQFGSSLNRLPINHIDMKNLLSILLIVFIQDFYLFLFLKPISKMFKNSKDGIAIILSSSMKNIAVASTILLLYSPKAAMAPAIGFLAHSVLFLPLLVSKIIKQN